MKRMWVFYVLNALLLRSQVILELKLWIFHHFGCITSDRYEGGLNLIHAPETGFGPRLTQTPEKDHTWHILTCFRHSRASFCLKPTRNALFTQFLSQNFPAASKMVIFCTKLAFKMQFWSVLVQNKDQKWFKKSHKMSGNAFRGGLGLFWSSKDAKMTKCCLMCIRAQALLEEAWVLWWVSKWVKTTIFGLGYTLTWFLDFWALFCLKPTRNALFTQFLSQNFPAASKMVIFCTKLAFKMQFWSVLVQNKDQKWFKKSHKMSGNAFRGGLGLFWSSKDAKMTKCCLMCIRAQALLEEAWVLWWVSKWVKTTIFGFGAYFDVFSWLLGFILPETDQKCTFYTIFGSKLSCGRYQASSN